MIRTVAAFGLETLEELRAAGLERPKAVIFDWDNTLIDSWYAILDAQNYTLTAFGLEPWTLEETRARVRGSMRDSFPALFGARWREAGEVFYRRFTERHMQTLRPLPGAAALLEELRKSGLYLAVVSNKKGDYLRTEAMHLGWNRHLSRIVGAFDAARDKPAAETVHMALKGSGIEAGSSVWFAGDADIDLECAVNASCIPVLLREGAPEPGEFPHPPIVHVDSCLELSKLLRNFPPLLSPRRKSKSTGLPSSPHDSSSRTGGWTPSSHHRDDPERPGRGHRVLDVAVRGGPAVTGHEIFVTAAILLPLSKPTGGWQSDIAFDPKGGQVTFHLTALGFDLLSSNKLTITVPENADSERVVFNLRVLAANTRWICVTAFQNAAQIGQITIKHFEFLDAERAHSVRDHIGRFFFADLTLIARSNSTIIEAWSEKAGCGMPMKEFRIPDSSQRALLRNTIKLLYDPQCSPSDQETELKIIGAELTRCLPPELIALLQTENVETICIQHDKAVDFPFELCWIDQKGFFLGDRIAICRWFIGTRNIPRISHAPISRIALLKGKSKASSDAVQLLKQTFPNCAVFNTTKDVVEHVLKTTQYDMLHFIGHCLKDEDGQAAIELEYGKLNLIRIGQLREESEFGKKEPFVTLSGCSTTAPFVALLEQDTFAHRFVEARACGFLGNLWPVDGRVANAFSHLFYHGLVSGQTVGQALMDAKRNLIDGVERTGGPELNPVAVKVAARSYSLFANPDLRLRFDMAQ